MNVDPEIAEARPAVLLASALHLLTCSAAHGMSAAKSASLIQHLTALAERPDTDPLLARACDELADVWHRLNHELAHRQQAEAEQRQALAERARQPQLH
ncbi:MAG: hypothetical protein CGU28_12185 [Candidatus Dactylopiibacterium carminicum]|uniref:Uncharacterized protein n=1 Tax=Candidatus Dactylopiibacterium carminicum TaxID=857335 RepID=A0A272EPU8_9RHOO|nr:hypothetical protein [Candidatus Dactylopiibacterium carminicum]KAF7598400.1 hypothetical protein BGI27_13485 [Candidatus Dactylopiibacterium carminicum]PAS92147.1 MAG: hypothetical protein CGU29_12855 [Candidatus Dactylopiibacterium carminicum]PAS95574.1 MAG: hypothetical protein CGU28_12185 [Candidatus Dactylopiibacterium carminicum]PAS97565.1 MAG: hypothetical protein BSR46_13510 [Candidatus Dactylopiibacterium carminicum]